MKESGFKGIVVNEFRHIFRDPQTLAILFLLPLLQMVLFGSALSNEIKSVPLVITDLDNSADSRALSETFSGSSFFTVRHGGTDKDLTGLFRRNAVLAAVTIPAGFSKNLARTGRSTVDVIIDGSDGNRALTVNQYITAAVHGYTAQRFPSAPFPVTLAPVYLYNPGLESAYFFVPGLTALIIIMVSALLTSLTITGEKESGTFELMKLSPVTAGEIILGKAVPYLLLSFVIGTVIIGCSRVIFAVPVRGNAVLLGACLLVYCLTGLSFGILVSTLVNTRLSAMMLAQIGTMLPTMFLSGFIFQTDSMPLPLRIASWGVPAKYFLTIIRGIMLKGNTLYELRFPILVLTLFSVLFLGLAVARFRSYLKK